MQPNILYCVYPASPAALAILSAPSGKPESHENAAVAKPKALLGNSPPMDVEREREREREREKERESTHLRITPQRKTKKPIVETTQVTFRI